MKSEEYSSIDMMENIPEKKSKKKLLLLLLLLLILVIGGIAAWSIFRNRNSGMDATTKYWFDKAAKNGSLKGMDSADIQSVLDNVVQEGMFNVTIDGDVTFETGTSQGYIGIANIAENRYYCRVTLSKNDDGTIIYQSDGLKPGQFIDYVTLKQSLPAGDYPCTANFIITDPETMDDIGQVNASVNVHILN